MNCAEVSLGAVAHNVRTIKAHIGSSVELFSVVKANAYGHGAVAVGRTALRHGAQRLAVARVSEGIELRQAGIDAPVLVMGYSAPHDVIAAVEHGLTLTVTETDVAALASARAAQLGRTATVHVKVDTGMGRFGLLPDEVVPFFRHLAGLPSLVVEGLFSHFSVADLADKTYTRQQFQTYQLVVAALQSAGFAVPLRHIANSAATLDLPEMHLDAVRAGIAIYGLHPSGEVEPVLPLKPALTLKSHVARVRVLPAGSSISYGRTFITPTEMRVALVPLGYGDGFHRILSNRGDVLIRGQRARILGRVCMDQFVVDVSGIPQAAVNDEVVLVGRQGDAEIRAEEVARLAETINYEVVTALLPRVPRVYTGEE